MFILHMWKNKNQGGNTLFYKINKGNFDKCLRGEENKVTDIFHRLDKLNTEINKYYNFKKEEWDKLNYYERQKIGSLKKYKPEKDHWGENFLKIPIIFLKDEMKKQEFRLMLFASYIFTRTRGLIKQRKMSLTDLNEMLGVNYKSLKELMRNCFSGHKDFFLSCSYEKLSKRIIFEFNDTEYHKALEGETLILTDDFDDIDF